MRRKQTKQSERAPNNAHTAGVFTRIKAFIVDMFMINMPILYFMVYVILGGRDAFLNNQTAIFVCTALFGFILSIFFAAAGQSPGYKAYDIKLTDVRTGKKPHFFKAYFRFLGFIFSGVTRIGLLLAFFRADKRCLHDIFSGTICTKCK
ncbi:MAG: RDD family protein [Campylobacteraceae bacterium]|jgi:uncharacterized RDD family membrane protein YckC|nr:RDD family protein [Campylobacteraceae bacterium]